MLEEYYQQIVILAKACGVVHPSQMGKLADLFLDGMASFHFVRETLSQTQLQEQDEVDEDEARDDSIRGLLCLGKLMTQASLLKEEGYQDEWEFLVSLCQRYQISFDTGLRCAFEILRWYQQRIHHSPFSADPFDPRDGEQYQIAVAVWKELTCS